MIVLGVVGTANGYLQLTLDLIHEIKVDEHVIVFFLQPVFDTDNTHNVWVFAVHFF